MIDFTGSKHNAQMLVERYLETGEQPDFMEYICFRSYYVEAKFKSYALEYVLDNFCIYAGIAKMQEVLIKESTTKSEVIKKVVHCYCPCKGQDLINEAKRRRLDFVMEDGTIKLTKSENDMNEMPEDPNSVYSNAIAS